MPGGTARTLWKDSYAGGLGYLDETQMQGMEAHLREHVYLTVQEVAA
ncbi:MAG: hypothetical protein ACREWG_04075 [Gammaproteobacteria bacterium]